MDLAWLEGSAHSDFMDPVRALPIYDPQLSLDDIIEDIFGPSVSVTRSRTLGGGCIGDVKCLGLSNRQQVVYKSYSRDSRKATSPEHRCIMEAIGLLRLADSHCIRVPHLYAIHGPSMLLSFHYHDSIRRPREFWQGFAHSLASLHNSDSFLYDSDDTSNLWGFSASPYDQQVEDSPHYTHESTTKTHPPYASWVEFYTRERIWSQCKRAHNNGYFDTALMHRAEAFCQGLSKLITDPERPSLIHGDLWGGNYLCEDDHPLLIDPAVHIAHYESEIALTQLFNGYPQSFRDAYSEILPLDKGYYSTRVHIYNLYHILNHLNLFGRSYYHQAVDIIMRFS